MNEQEMEEYRDLVGFIRITKKLEKHVKGTQDGSIKPKRLSEYVKTSNVFEKEVKK